MVSPRPARIAAFAALTLVVCASARAQEIASPALVIDASTGAVIHAESATRPWHPASTTKLMTAYVALKSVRTGALTMDTPLRASARAAAQPPSKLGIRPGQTITLDNALKILMVKSANDLAVVIAEGVGGSVESFAGLMNAEARRLGMRESHFTNPHGLHSADQQSSARDLAILARALLSEFSDQSDLFGIGAVQLGTRVMKNTNGLIGRYPGANGMKTGFICPSGFNVVASASRGGRTLIAVVMGAGSAAERTVKVAQLFDKGFASYGSGSGALATLSDSGYSTAPNMRQEICRKGRRIPLGEDEAEGAISYATFDSGSDRDSMSLLIPGLARSSPQSGAARSVGAREASGRVVLAARAELPTIPVYLGPAPGSTALARGPGSAPALPAAASAFAATPPRQPGISPALPETPARAVARNPGQISAEPNFIARESAPTGGGAPLALPGAISARGTAAAEPRPASAAGLRTRPVSTTARPAAEGAAEEAAPATTGIDNPEVDATSAGQNAKATPKSTARSKARDNSGKTAPKAKVKAAAKADDEAPASKRNQPKAKQKTPEKTTTRPNPGANRQG